MTYSVMITTSLNCSRDRKILAILAVMIALTPDITSSAPRPSSDHSLLSALRGSSDQLASGNLAMGRDWGLNPAAIAEFKNKNLDTNTLQQILSRSNPPSIVPRFLMKDNLFLRHLWLYLDSPNEHHFHQLKNRAKTLRRRRTDEVSTRFFLRD
eukprot:GFUD01018533.1.p1 GENE.GFUD01018533.1~~GFUD01018533.1.p1  ORF type:complete len:154 (-),score=23.78 GFUD01018533.1:105-566(-)